MADLDTVTTEELATELYLRSDMMILYIFQDGTALTSKLTEAVSISILEGELDWVKVIRDALSDTIHTAEEHAGIDISEEFRERLIFRLNERF